MNLNESSLWGPAIFTCGLFCLIGSAYLYWARHYLVHDGPKHMSRWVPSGFLIVGIVLIIVGALIWTTPAHAMGLGEALSTNTGLTPAQGFAQMIASLAIGVMLMCFLAMVFFPKARNRTTLIILVVALLLFLVVGGAALGVA